MAHIREKQILHAQAADDVRCSDIGNAAMTKLAPSRLVGLVMGSWFLATAAGNYIAGIIAAATGGEGLDEAAASNQVLEVYSSVGWVAVIVGVAVIAVSPFVARLMHQDEEQLRQDRALAGQREVAEPGAPGIDPDGGGNVRRF